MPENSASQITETAPIVDAGLAARALASVLDYIIVTAFFIIASWSSENSDMWFLLSLGVGAIYFTFFHSATTKGQTIGKKMFGLRVVSFKGPQTYLSAPQSLLRYFCYLGFLILVAEVPPLIYRRMALVQNAMILESYMLVAMAYFFANISCLLFGRDHRALHDHIAGSVVLRCAEAPDRAAVDAYLAAPRVLIALPPILRKTGFHCAAGVVLACFLWSFGFSSNTDLNLLRSQHYRLENHFPILVESAGVDDDKLLIYALLLDSKVSQSDLAVALAAFIKDAASASPLSAKKINFTFYPDPKLRVDAQPDQAPDAFEVILDSMQVTKLPQTVPNL